MRSSSGLVTDELDLSTEQPGPCSNKRQKKQHVGILGNEYLHEPHEHSSVASITASEFRDTEGQ